MADDELDETVVAGALAGIGDAAEMLGTERDDNNDDDGGAGNVLVL